MTKTEIENKIYDLKRVIESCKNIIKANENEIKKLEAKAEKPAFERAEEGKKYYAVIVDSYKGLLVKEYLEEYMSFDESMFKNNNYFLTKERAKEVADKINFLLKLERLHDTFCPGYKPDWDDKSKAKWTVVFDYDKNKYASYWNAVTDNRTIVYFDSSKTADKVCETLNKGLENEDM